MITLHDWWLDHADDLFIKQILNEQQCNKRLIEHLLLTRQWPSSGVTLVTSLKSVVPSLMEDMVLCWEGRRYMKQANKYISRNQEECCERKKLLWEQWGDLIWMQAAKETGFQCVLLLSMTMTTVHGVMVSWLTPIPSPSFWNKCLFPKSLPSLWSEQPVAFGDSRFDVQTEMTAWLGLFLKDEWLANPSISLLFVSTVRLSFTLSDWNAGPILFQAHGASWHCGWTEVFSFIPCV